MRLIDADALMEELSRWLKIEAIPVKKGKWIKIDDPDDTISGKCSVCGWEAHLYEDDVVGMPYCPNCGTPLEGVEE